MKHFGSVFCASFVTVAALVAAPAVNAGVDISFGMNAPIGNDGNLFFSISSRYFDREPQVVNDWGRRFPNPDDLAVFLHICSHSHMSPDVVFSYRNRGMTWYDVSVRAGVPFDTWYVPVERDPGPPYGKAYGHWKKHQRDPRHVVRLSDRQACDLVAVRMAHDYYGVAPETAMDWRRGGANVQTIMTREYRERHHGSERSHDEGHEKQHGRGHNKHGGD